MKVPLISSTVTSRFNFLGTFRKRLKLIAEGFRPPVNQSTDTIAYTNSF